MQGDPRLGAAPLDMMQGDPRLGAAARPHLPQRHAPANPDQAWFWSITEYVEPRSGLSTSGMAETLDAAKAAFRESYDKWRARTTKAEI